MDEFWTLDRAYRGWQSAHYPVVVTTDAALHTAHLLFDWHQRFLEVAHLRSDLVNLSDALAARMMATMAPLRRRRTSRPPFRPPVTFWWAST